MLLLAGKVAFGGAGFAAGVKLVAMARTGDAGGSHALAAGAIFVGGSGLVLLTVGEGLPSAPLALGGEILMRLGMLGLCVFLWKVFRPRGAGGPLGVAACAAIMAGTLAWDWHAQTQGGTYDRRLASAMTVQVSLGLPFAWSAWETGAQWSRSRRRRALGLVDPMVCHRFALWCLATSALLAICGLAVVTGVLDRMAWTTASAISTGLRGVLYLAAVAAVWLGLFPPAAYVRRIAGRESAAA